jgi:hypothetical protein
MIDSEPAERLSDAAFCGSPHIKEQSPMTTRPSLLRSIPFWLLIVGSLATVVYGAWILVTTTGTMTTGLAAQTATTADVYVGQIVAIFGGVLVGTGLIGLALALVLGVIRSLIPAPAAEIVEPIDWNDEEEVVVAEAAPVVAAEPLVEAEPVAAEPVVAEAEPVAEKPADEETPTR